VLKTVWNLLTLKDDLIHHPCLRSKLLLITPGLRNCVKPCSKWHSPLEMRNNDLQLENKQGTTPWTLSDYKCLNGKVRAPELPFTRCTFRSLRNHIAQQSCDQLEPRGISSGSKMDIVSPKTVQVESAITHLIKLGNPQKVVSSSIKK